MLLGWCARRWECRCSPSLAVNVFGPSRSTLDLLVPLGCTRVVGLGRRSPRTAPRDGAVTTDIAATLQSFFTERLTTQRQASEHTIASCRDSCRLLLEFMQRRTGTLPSRLQWRAASMPTWCRRSSITSKPTATTAHAPATPPHRDKIAVRLRLAAPPRARRLDQTEATALLAAPDRTWTGQRDYTLTSDPVP